MNNSIDQVNKILERVENPSQYFNESIICYAQDNRVFQAIDPSLGTVSMYRRDTDQLIGIMCFYGLHPTVMGFNNPLISSDVFGVARSTIENSSAAYGSKVSFFNGAGGDVSANWFMQNRANTHRIADSLAIAVLNTFDNAAVGLVGNVKTSLDYVSVKGNLVQDSSMELESLGITNRALSDVPTIGKASLAGTEDGRTEFINRDRECFYEESVIDELHLDRPQANKKEHKISKLAAKAVKPYFPIGSYKLGQIRIGAIPGEVTVALADQLKSSIGDEESEMEIIVSMSNGYLSYFTTPQEYVMQHYEGAFSVFGVATGIFLREQLRIVSDQTSKVEGSTTRRYNVGIPINRNRIRDKLNNSWNKHTNLESCI